MEKILEKFGDRYRTRMLFIGLLDVMTIVISYYTALWIRFDFSITSTPRAYIIHLTWFLPLLIALYLICYSSFHLYHSIWRFASISEAMRIILAYLIIIAAVMLLNLIPVFRLPYSVVIIGVIFSGIFCVGIRFGYRFVRYLMHRGQSDSDVKESGSDNVLLFGAGQAAREIIRDVELGSHHSQFRIAAVVDDANIKQGRYLEGYRIIGNRYDIPRIVKEKNITRIVFAIPTASPEQRREILNICKDTGCKIQTVPGIYQILNEEVRVSMLRDIDITDLLGREEIQVNNDEIMESVGGKIILVTGGGGSIGAELCRQIAAAGPKQLIIFDVYENNAYEIQQELKRNYPALNLVTLIGSVRNTNRINSVLNKYKPNLIIHAAAHKHVPLMEESPNEAIKNNVMGTYKLAVAACEAKVERFLLISTDKAVNPTNIMGASKRLCEMIIQMMDRHCDHTAFVAVRFGNVLGSNGSVIPLFRKQIAAGGPVTVTDPNVQRYFMTIPEAVSLVLQASYYAKGGEIFVLDMGEPIKIDDLARNLIKLSGLKPDEDIQIVYTGLRPGEKMFEEILMDEEGMKETANKLIKIGKPIEFDDDAFIEQLVKLDQLANAEDGHIEEMVASIVPTYRPRKAA